MSEAIVVCNKPEESFLSGKKEKVTFVIHDIKHCGADSGADMYSESILVHGFSWCIQVKRLYEYYEYKEGDGMDGFEIRLVLESEGYTDTEYTDQAVAASYKLWWGHLECENTKRLFYTNDSDTEECLSIPYNVRSPTSIKLEIDVYKRVTPYWYPKLTGPEEIVKALVSTHSKAGSITIKVKCGTKFHVQADILQTWAPVLYDLIKEDNGEKVPNVTVDFPVNKDSFQMLFNFLYAKTDNITNHKAWKDKNQALLFLRVANSAGCVNMKLYSESVLVEHHLKPTNAAELLLLADANSCALLKEAAMSLCVQEKKVDLQLFNNSTKLCTEVLMETRKMPAPRADKKRKVPFDQMDVRSLRECLVKAGLEVDGTKETIAKRIKDHTSKKGKTHE